MESRSVTRITVNGRTYNSIEEMPAEVRAEYERAMGMLADENSNGVPDVVEQATGDEGTFVSQVTHSHQYIVNGQEVEDLEHVPAELRRMIASSSSSISETNEGGGKTVNYHVVNRIGSNREITLHLSWGTLVALIAAIIAFVGVLMWLR